MNSAPAGTPKPIPNTDDRSNYGKDTPVPGRGSTGGSRTFDESDSRRFEQPDINSGRTGTELPPKKPPFGTGRGTGTGTAPIDDGFGPRPGDTDGKPDPFKANKPELNDPVLPNVPEKLPAAPAQVKEEAPVDAALDLDGKMTNRPVLMRDRFVTRTRFTASSVARTPVRPAHDWSAVPSTARVVR